MSMFLPVLKSSKGNYFLGGGKQITTKIVVQSRWLVKKTPFISKL